ncbi:MAG: hypothetical protein E7258_08295 [Lachnospiraceae bacterium]|nr:hypothetical protein [Lachnospiraceae bacterium]
MIIVGGMSLGVMVALSMKKRVEELRQLERILNYIQGELSYKNSILKEAFYEASFRTKPPFDKWLIAIKELIEESEDMTFFEIWEKSLIVLRGESHLKREDISELMNIGQTLGYLDVSAQQMGLALEKDNLHSNIVRLDKGLLNNMKVAVILGILGGIFLVVVLV